MLRVRGDQKMTKTGNWLLITIALGLITAGSLRGQATADILGRVSDASGATVPMAKITLANLDTNQTRTADSSDTGDFVFNLLPPCSTG